MKHIYNIGIYPPPYGGVSNHIKRLSEFLSNNEIKNSIIYNSEILYNDEKFISFSFKNIIKLLISKKKQIFHSHDYNLKRLFILYLLSFRNKTILSFHNERFLDYVKSLGFIKGKFYYLLLSKINFIIVDNNKCEKLIKNLVNHDRIKVIPEFIPPLEIPPLPDKILQIIKNKKLVLSSNAFRISFHNNEDLYGIDLLIDLTSLLKNDGYDFVFIFLLPDIGDHEYFKKLNTKISQLELNEHFIFITEPLEEAASLWKHSDIVFRATNTDGNSLTILEALSLNKIVIASDCVERPENTILFKTRDLNSLYQTSKNIINNIENYKNRKYEYDSYQNAKKFLDLYLSIFGEVK